MGWRDHGKSGADRGIEALQVSNLADAAEPLRQADEFVGFGEGNGASGFSINTSMPASINCRAVLEVMDRWVRRLRQPGLRCAW